MHARLLTIGYRDGRRIHETLIDSSDNPRLLALARQLRTAGNVERFFAPARDLYEELLKTGWNVNSTGELDGRPALECAARVGSVDAVRVLLDHGAMPTRSRGANPNVRDRKGATPLHRAAARSNTGFISLLVASGADVEARDADSRTPLMIAAGHCRYWKSNRCFRPGPTHMASLHPIGHPPSLLHRARVSRNARRLSSCSQRLSPDARSRDGALTSRPASTWLEWSCPSSASVSVGSLAATVARRPGSRSMLLEPCCSTTFPACVLS